jgi:hypothetical protein
MSMPSSTTWLSFFTFSNFMLASFMLLNASPLLGTHPQKALD